MIRRETGSEYFLITQNDHAILAGQLAERFGNDRFAPPQPRESVLTGVRMHDAGWPLHDDSPTLNRQHHPLDVFEVPRVIAMKVWTASADRAQAVDPYAGLLASLHALALSVYATSLDSQNKNGGWNVVHLTEKFDLNKFQHREVERQEQLRQQLRLRTDLPLTHGIAEPRASGEDDQLAFNFRLLQAMDLLSLCLCCTHPPADRTNDVFPRPGASPLHLSLRRTADDVLHVRPWPFDVPRIALTVPFRRVGARAYQNCEDLLNALNSAAIEQLPLCILAD